MRRFSVFLLVVVLALSLSFIPAAAAQENTTDDAPTLEISEGDTDVETYAQEIDSALRLMEWDYDDDREGFVLTFESDTSKRITITEAVQFSEGSGSGRIYSSRLPSGVTEVFVPVQRRGGQAAVTMTTRESIAENRFSYVSTGEAKPDRPAIPYERVRLLVAFTAIGAGGFVFRVVRKKREDETKEAERLL